MKLNINCIATMRLSAIKGIGLKTFHHLLQHFGAPQDVLRASFQELRACGLSAALSRKICELDAQADRSAISLRLQKAEHWSQNESCSIMCLQDADYPAALKQIYQAPPILYAQGDLSFLKCPSIAIVGSRKASLNAQKHAYEFAKGLVAYGINVVSGLALGVDAKAHSGAIAAGGMTTAVLGSGIDIIYPRQNRPLANQIIDKGLLLSELPLGSAPLPANFPRRNRVVSGICSGVLVVEASEKSGSLITARFALEQNRDVFAIPGPIDSLNSKGTNDLIKQGAQLVSCVEEIVETMSFNGLYDHSKSLNLETSRINSECLVLPEVPGQEETLKYFAPEKVSNQEAKCSSSKALNLSEDEHRVYELVAYRVSNFDELVQNGLQCPSKTSQVLLMLELKGLIVAVAGGYQRVKEINSASSL